MNPAPPAGAGRVLIVDPSAESRAVLRTLLERFGVESFEASRPEQGAELRARIHPDLILLDLDSDRSADQQAARSLGAEADRTATPIVVLGAPRRPKQWPGGGEVVAKPYHYGALARRIEALLAGRRAA